MHIACIPICILVMHMCFMDHDKALLDPQVKMREIEKAMRQMEKGGSHKAKASRQFSEAALLSPTSRTDSGSPTGRVTPPGTSGSGLATPSGKVTPPATTGSGLATPTGRVMPPGSTGSGLATPTGRVTPPGTTPAAMESGLTTPTSRVTQYGLNSGRSSPVDAASDAESSHVAHLFTSTGSAAAATVIIDDRSAHSAVAAAAIGHVSSDIRAEADLQSEDMVPRLLSSRSSVRDAVLLYKGSHPSSSRQPVGSNMQLPFNNRQHIQASGQALSYTRQGTVIPQKPSTSFSADTQMHKHAGRQLNRLATSKSSVAYQTKSLSEGVYGKLYSSKSSLHQDAISASWEPDNAAAQSSGLSTSGSGRHVASWAEATASGGIGRFGGGIGRGGLSALAPEPSCSVPQQSDHLSSSER